MFSIARTILLCQKQTIHTFCLKNGLQNICGSGGREYSTYLTLVLSKQKCYNVVSDKYTCRFYCSTKSPTIPKGPPSTPQPSVKSDAAMKAPVKTQRVRDESPRVDEYMIMESHRRKDGKVMTYPEKLRENVRTSGYALIMIVGLGVFATMFIMLGREFFSSNSPNNIYSSSYKLCKANKELQDAVGMPMKSYGEETRRGYRRHVAHQEFSVAGIKHIRMKYYIQGAFRKGTVHLEKIGNKKGDFDAYSYLIVDLDGYPSKRIIIDDGGFAEDDAEIAM